MNLSQNLAFWQTTIIKTQNTILIATVRDRVIARRNFKTRCAPVNQEAGDFLLDTARCLFFTCGNKDNHKIGDIGVANEMLGAIDDPIISIWLGGTLHTAYIRPRPWFCQG